MRRIALLFIVLGFISLLSTSSHAQRGISGHVLTLDDGSSHLVNITVPTMTGPGPYSWMLPITAGGTALSLPAPTIAGSTLYSNGTSWIENTGITENNQGILTASNLSATGGPSIPPLTITNTGSSTFPSTFTGAMISNTVNVGAAGANKIGVAIASTGAFTGGNTGLTFSVSGGSTNYDIQGTGGTPSWSVTSAGVATFAYLSTSGGFITAETINYNNQQTSPNPSAANTVTVSPLATLTNVPAGAATGDVTVTITAPAIGNGQLLYLWNSMGNTFNLLVGGVTIPDGGVAQFIYLGGVWRHVQ